MLARQHIRMLRNRRYPCRFQGFRKDFCKSECVLMVAYEFSEVSASPASFSQWRGWGVRF